MSDYQNQPIPSWCRPGEQCVCVQGRWLNGFQPHPACKDALIPQFMQTYTITKVMHHPFTGQAGIILKELTPGVYYALYDVQSQLNFVPVQKIEEEQHLVKDTELEHT